MSRPGERRIRRRVAAVLFFSVCGIGIFVMVKDSSGLGARTAALVAIAAAFAIARAVVGGSQRLPDGGDPGIAPRPCTGWPGWRLWVAAAVLALGAVASFGLMLVSQAHGGRMVWPLFAFVGFILAGAAVSSTLVFKLLRRWLGGWSARVRR